MAPHSSTLAWRVPWTEEPGRLQSMGSLRVGHDWTTSLSRIGERNGNPLQCSCLENPRDVEPGGLPSMGLHTVRHDWSDLAAAAAVWRVSIHLQNLLYIFIYHFDFCGFSPVSYFLVWFPYSNISLPPHHHFCVLTVWYNTFLYIINKFKSTIRYIFYIFTF